MSKLNELIAQLCPEGVVFSPLVSVADVLYGFPCDASLFNTDGIGMPLARIRDVLAGKTDTYTIEQVPERYILSRGDLLVGMDGNFHVANWKTDGGILCQRVCKIYSKDEAILLNGFLSHLLKPIMKRIEDNKQGGTVKHLLDKDIKAITIPVPPVPVQSEIVRILDNFTELTAELTVELTAELTAREQQYEYYREKLLGIEAGNFTTIKTIGEVAVYRRGSFPQPYGKPEWYDGEGAMPFVQVADIGEDMRLVSDTKRKISKVAQFRSVFAPKGSIIISLQGSIGRVAITQYDAYIDRTVAIFHDISKELLPKYFVYQLQRVFAEKEKTARGSTIKTITKEEFTAFSIAIPPLEEQERIVAILDRFNDLHNDISAGLPTEIEARQKQYEYYRDKLLTFKERVD